MYERATPKPRASTRKESGRVISLRTTFPTLQRAASNGLPSPPPSEKNIVDATLHALQNCLQNISMGIELAHLDQSFVEQEYARLQQSVGLAGRWALELREYCCPPVVKSWTGNLAAAIEEAVQDVAHEWKQPGQTTRVVCSTPLAEFSLDWRQLTKAVQRLVFCASAMLPVEGGEVIVESGVRNIGPQPLVDIRVQSHGKTPLFVEEKALFCPFACINNRQLGLSLVLAQQTAVRLQGQLYFHKTSAHHGCFTLLLRM